MAHYEILKPNWETGEDEVQETFNSLTKCVNTLRVEYNINFADRGGSRCLTPSQVKHDLSRFHDNTTIGGTKIRVRKTS